MANILSNVFETGLNEVFFQVYSKKDQPGEATLEQIFKTANSEKRSEYDQRMTGIGRIPVKGTSAAIEEDYIKEKYKTTYTFPVYAKSLLIDYEDIKDELYGVLKDGVQQLGIAARDTQYANAFVVFRRANNGSYLGADSQSLVDGAHPIEGAGTYSNMVASAFSVSAVESAIQKMGEQKADRGIFIPQVPSILLVPPARWAESCKLLLSEKEAFTANNQINFVSTMFPGLQVLQSRYIGAAEVSGTAGSDTNCFLLSDMHKIKRFVREPLKTWLQDWDTTRNMNAFYNIYFREGCGFSDSIGIVGIGAGLS